MTELGETTEIASRIAGRLSWRAFTDHVDTLADSAVRDLDTNFAIPDLIRTTPGRWVKRLLDGDDEPRLRFVRCLDHVLFEQPGRRARLAWATTPWLCGLTILRLHDELVKDDGPKALGRSPHLRALRELSLTTDMTAAGVADLVGALPRELHTLRLQRNRRMGARGIEQLASLTSLCTLHLGRNQLDDAALDALGSWSGLVCLDLDNNAFTDAGLERLCASGRLDGLRELNLSNNPIGLRGCRALAASAALAHLERLYLHNCGLTDETAAVLLESRHLVKLRNLALSANRLEMRSIEQLASSHNLDGLYELDVCHNRFDADDASARLRDSPHLASVRRLCT